MNIGGLIQRAVNTLIVIGAVLFAASRLMMVYSSYHTQHKRMINDHAFCARNCDVHIIKEIGEENSASCPTTCNAEPASWSRAFEYMLNNTYACGDEPCQKKFRDVVSDWRLMVGFVGFMFTLPYVMWTWVQVAGGKMISLWRRQKRRKKLLRAQSASFVPADDMDDFPLKPPLEETPPLLRLRTSCGHPSMHEDGSDSEHISMSVF